MLNLSDATHRSFPELLATLGIDPERALDSVVPAEIKKAWKHCLSKFQPDRLIGEERELAEIKIGDVNDAYRILKDPAAVAAHAELLEAEKDAYALEHSDNFRGTAAEFDQMLDNLAKEWENHSLTKAKFLLHGYHPVEPVIVKPPLLLAAPEKPVEKPWQFGAEEYAATQKSLHHQEAEVQRLYGQPLPQKPLKTPAPLDTLTLEAKSGSKTKLIVGGVIAAVAVGYAILRGKSKDDAANDKSWAKRSDERKLSEHTR